MTTYGKIYVNVLPVSSNSFGTSSTTTTTDLCAQGYRVRGMFPSTPAELAVSFPFQGYDETTATYGKIEYTIFYSNNNAAKKMVKPIIIVDGFDPKDKRKVQDCDCENDPTCKLANSDVVFSFSTNPHIQLTFNPLKHTSIVDSLDYLDGTIDPATGVPRTTNFMSDLRTLGYDVIIINQPTYDSVDTAGNAKNGIEGGADYIERNALALVSFIKNYIKPQQNLAASTEGLVLIGPSMGGQITRYALAYMEKKFAQTGDVTWKHNARLWVSVDSPHLGGSIPVGAQANIWFTADETMLDKKEGQDSYAELNSAAGKQQSIANFEFARNSPAHNLLGSPFFTTYYNNVNSNGVTGSNGFPVSTPTFRKIAMVNGSLTGTKQGSESQTFLYTRIFIRGLFPFQSSTITLARFHDSFMAGYGGNGQVFQGDGQTTRFSLHLFSPCFPCFPHPQYAMNVNNQDIRGSLDVVPAGYLRFGNILKTSLESGAS